MEAATADRPKGAQQQSVEPAEPKAAATPEPKADRGLTTYKVLASVGKLVIVVGDYPGHSQADAKKAGAQTILDRGVDEDKPDDDDQTTLYGKLTGSGLELVAVPHASWKPQKIAVEKPEPRLKLG